MSIFNQDIHDNLLDHGFRHNRVEESWEECGDAENGPQLDGGPAYDEYMSNDSYIIIDHEGHFVHHSTRDAAFEEWLAAQGV